MPLVVEKYHGDTTHLTTIQHGAYLLLLMAYWRRGGPLPCDDSRLAAIARMTPQEWKRQRPIIAEFFDERDGLWFQKRAELELDRARKKSEAAAESARARWERNAGADANASKAHTEPDADRMRTHSGRNAPPSSIPVDADASPGERTAEKPKSRRSAANHPLPSDWEPNTEHIRKAAELGLDCAREAERMRNWALAGGARCASWDARFHNWLFRAVEINNGHGNNRGQHGRPARSGATQRDIQLAAALGSCRDEGSGAALRDADYRERSDDQRGEV
jgi:uncharacterized protein YdaU (DUF1376 family)